jgi:hypothetical protein
MMETGLTLVTNATKHSTPMANVVRLNTLLISAPVSFPFRALSNRCPAPVALSSNSFSKPAFNMSSRCQARLKAAAGLTRIVLKTVSDGSEIGSSRPSSQTPA